MIASNGELGPVLTHKVLQARRQEVGPREFRRGLRAAVARLTMPAVNPRCRKPRAAGGADIVILALGHMKDALPVHPLSVEMDRAETRSPFVTTTIKRKNFWSSVNASAESGKAGHSRAERMKITPSSGRT